MNLSFYILWNIGEGMSLVRKINMFNISLTSGYDKIINSVPYKKFKIKIGNFEEHFLSPLCSRSVDDY